MCCVMCNVYGVRCEKWCVWIFVDAWYLKPSCVDSEELPDEK
jgi:hypothetical protein